MGPARHKFLGPLKVVRQPCSALLPYWDIPQYLMLPIGIQSLRQRDYPLNSKVITHLLVPEILCLETAVLRGQACLHKGSRGGKAIPWVK